MARGFESKDVEFQQAEAERKTRLQPARPPHEQAMVQRRETLELALTRARAERASAAVPAHQRMLDQAIDALESDLRSLSN